MNQNLFEELLMNETDLDGALQRVCGDEELYVSFLSAFLNDTTMDELKKAIDEKSWNAAFTAAHALKGLAGNLGFTPLFHSLGELVISIRAGRMLEINDMFYRAKMYYNDIVTVIRQNIDK